MKFTILSFFVFFNIQAYFLLAQNNSSIDSLQNLVLKANSDTLKIIQLNNLALEYSFENNDSAINISRKAIKLALKTLSLTNNEEIKQSAILNAENSCYQISSFYTYKGNHKLSLFYSNKALTLCNYLQKVYSNKKFILNCKSKVYSNIGNSYYIQGNYPFALDFYFKSLKIAEEIKNKRIITTNSGNIGIIYKYQGNYIKAIEYYLKALKFAEEMNNKNKISAILGNIGILYDTKGDTVKAMLYYNKAINVAKEIDNKSCIETNLISIGDLLERQHKFNEALNCYLNALNIANELNDISNITVLQGNIGSLYTSTKKYYEAEKYLKSAITGADSINYLQAIKEFNFKLSELYEKTGKPDFALRYYKKAVIAKDSLFSEDKNQEITRKEMNFVFEKKQNAIKAEQDKKDAVNSANKIRQKLILIFVTSLLILVVIFTIFIFKSLRLTRKQKVIVEEKNCELNSQNEEILSQRDEIEAQRESLFIQKNELEKVHDDLKSSIRYAKQIQSALLPSNELLKSFLNEYFVFFKPCEIVSGDFYWITRRNEWLLFAVADCTGHGVPGGFMSMLGISFLNEIIPKDYIKDAGKTLDELRNYIIRSLKQQGVSGEQKDGMDIAFCALNTDTLELNFAGANNPLYIISNVTQNDSVESDSVNKRDSSLIIQNDKRELIELKSDKMPVAIHIKMDNFKNNIFQLQKGDTIYLFTDGFADQFGGDKGRKFKYSKLKELFLEITHLPMESQLREIEKTFNKWKGNLNQVDDVTILGIKI